MISVVYHEEAPATSLLTTPKGNLFSHQLTNLDTYFQLDRKYGRQILTIEQGRIESGKRYLLGYGDRYDV